MLVLDPTVLHPMTVESVGLYIREEGNPIFSSILSSRAHIKRSLDRLPPNEDGLFCLTARLVASIYPVRTDHSTLGPFPIILS